MPTVEELILDPALMPEIQLPDPAANTEKNGLIRVQMDQVKENPGFFLDPALYNQVVAPYGVEVVAVDIEDLRISDAGTWSGNLDILIQEGAGTPGLGFIDPWTWAVLTAWLAGYGAVKVYDEHVSKYVNIISPGTDPNDPNAKSTFGWIAALVLPVSVGYLAQWIAGMATEDKRWRFGFGLLAGFATYGKQEDWY